MIYKLMALFLCVLVFGCSQPPEEPKKMAVAINNYEITAQEFEAGFAQSPFASRTDKDQAKEDYLNNLINQKLILQDAQGKNLDKNKEFLQSIERFWEQSLLTVALNTKSKEIAGSAHVTEEETHRIYERRIKEGGYVRSYEQLYPQIKSQAQKQKESQLLNDWVESLRKTAQIKINKNVLKADQ